MPFAAGGSHRPRQPPRSGGFSDFGYSPMDALPRFPDHDGAQCVRRHLLRSGFSWTGPRRAGFGCKVTSCSGCAILQISKCDYQALGIGESGHWTKHQETLEPRRTPGLRSQRTRLLRPQARSFSFAPGRVGFPRRSDPGTATGSSAKVARPTKLVDRLGKPGALRR